MNIRPLTGRTRFTSYAGTEVKVDGKKYLIMNESDIQYATMNKDVKNSFWNRGTDIYP